MIDNDFRTLLMTLVPAGTVIEKSKVSNGQPKTRLCFQRASSNLDLHLNGDAGLRDTIFDVEVAAWNDDTTVQTLTDGLKNGITRTTLNGGINDSTLSVVVTSAAGLPTADAFTIQVESETMKVTGIVGNTLTVVRGFNGTTPAVHANGVSVTVHGLDGFRGVFGGTTALGIFVADHVDDYQPAMLDADEGYDLATFQATVIHQ